MALSAAFWFVPLFSYLSPHVSAACNSTVSCLCGSTNISYTLCTDAIIDSRNPCDVWTHCRTCQDNVLYCIACPENRTGPMCLEARQTRKKRQYVVSNQGRPGTMTIDGSFYGSCPRLESPDLGSMNCRQIGNFRSCTGRCLPGYNFLEYPQEQITLECRRGMWMPRLTFPPCISGGHCDLVVDGAGSFNCTTGMDGTRCDIYCSGMYQGRYHCFPERGWNPFLPHCIRPKESNSERTPPCLCQNNGFCDSEGNCICRNGWMGTYCDRTPSIVCTDPGVVSNADRLNTDGSPSRSDQVYTPRQAVVYNCREGFVLRGKSMITCTSTGQWSGTVPRCSRIRGTAGSPPIGNERTCREPEADFNGFIEDKPLQNSRRRGRYPSGTHITFRCHEGYRSVGAVILYCLQTGEWSSLPPTCEEIDPIVTEAPPDINAMTCKYPDVDPNGEIEETPFIDARNRNQRFPPGTEVTYTCKDGYRLNGAEVIFCLLSGEWSRSAPTCTLVSGTRTAGNCPNVQPISNGRFVVNRILDERRRPEDMAADEDYNEPEDDDSDFPPGTRLEFNCIETYALLGSSNMVCLPTGNWDEVPPICVEDCGRSLMVTTHKITNGSSTQEGEWPWTVAILINNRDNRTRLECGGALLDNQTVLTAAHCVHGFSSVTLYLGKYHRSNRLDDDKVQKRRTTRIVTHENFDNVTYENDIALLRFEPSVTFSERIQPICLPVPGSKEKNLVPGRRGYVTGWGLNENKLLSDKLMVAHLPVQPDYECMEAYEQHGLGDGIPPGMFCAGFTAGVVSACRGDSGSPLVFLDTDMHRHTIEGLVSFGQRNKECGEPRTYTVFTKVAHYMPWILEHWNSIGQTNGR